MDHLGTKRVGIRHTTGGVMISRLDSDEHLELTSREWEDLLRLVAAVEAYSRWDES